ncbi:MAG: DnaA regulatory inactivator Hda [Candidatus Accumulibacter sp.]|uniref:DnaA regulatory inactivator Hda n=1 Tax=Accumulibacter sp. TaxID=2053492 RepID=UPI002878AA43|nr:DnaA regulatory inactivator Hda [Accumulibacter sp.]MDS4014492.1 DnaA regulatory inactivator Hda [Accumulibacter sp.]
MRQLILDLLPEANPAFEDFVVGGNSETLTALAAWLMAENSETLFFLWGDSGAGKTHLLRASSPGSYRDARADPELSSIAGSAPCLAVDNVEALSEQGQLALFNQINRRRANGGRLLAAANVAPAQLQLREDLRTRLASGMLYRLLALPEAEQLAALTEHARRRGLVLPPPVLHYLFARAPRDMRSLTALLTAIEQYALEHKRPITLPLLREVLHTAASGCA